LLDILDRTPAGPALVYCTHSTVAEALWLSLDRRFTVGLVTGKTTPKKKQQQIQAFKDGELDILIGTATLGTGTDGLDRVCDLLILFDDTDDDAARRQLVGRIMPRGGVGDVSSKRVHRINLSS
jgi:superfamily II DNA/RNA helicase